MLEENKKGKPNFTESTVASSWVLWCLAVVWSTCCCIIQWHKKENWWNIRVFTQKCPEYSHNSLVICLRFNSIHNSPPYLISSDNIFIFWYGMIQFEVSERTFMSKVKVSWILLTNSNSHHAFTLLLSEVMRVFSSHTPKGHTFFLAPSFINDDQQVSGQSDLQAITLRVRKWETWGVALELL